MSVEPTTSRTAPPSSTRKASGAGAARRIQRAWERLSPLPGGKWLFSRLVGWTAPYTGTLDARVEALEPGYCRVALADRRRVRNHLRSVHAVALMNLAEMTSGLAAIFSMDPSLRGIITHLEMDYVKKARGRIRAECRIDDLDSLHRHERHEVRLAVELTDPEGETVARGRAHWLLGE